MSEFSILVQVIQVTWDKSDRGSSGAERRNNVPYVLPLPEELMSQPGRPMLIHESRWGQSNHFADEISSSALVFSAAGEFRFGCATVRSVTNGAELEWKWDSDGMPPRRFWDTSGNFVPVSHRCVACEKVWVRSRWNARFSCIDTGTWWYELVTVNVGVCPAPDVPRDFFQRSKPGDEYLQLAQLW